MPRQSPALHLIPLGGLGAIGMNLMLLRAGDDYMMIDCGLQFPDPAQAGVERLLPNLETLGALGDKLRGIVLTHGHEDHIGALHWVLDVVDAPIFGTAFTLGLLRKRLEDRGLQDPGALDLRRVSPGDRVQVGAAFEVSFLRVTHSIPDCVALNIQTPAGTVVHTGDWKIDPAPFDGCHFDREGLRAAGDAGVVLLLSDSTNALVPGHTRSEAEVGGALEDLVADWEGRAVVSMFSSNLYRLSSLWRIAKRTGRRFCTVGRSIETYLEVGRETTGIDLPGPHEILEMNQVAATDPAGVLVVCTGSQAEPRSALVRAARGNHPHLRLGPEDLVVFSSRIIPGHERAVHRLTNALSRRGCKVVHGSRIGAHASGHAQKDELRQMIELVRPRHFVPVHGEYTFLQAHAEIARSAGVASVTVAENGAVFDVGEPGLRQVGAVDAAPFVHDGGAVGSSDSPALKEKMRLAWNGAIGAEVLLHRGRRSGRSEVRLRSAGLFTEDGVLLHEAAELVEAELSRADPHLDREAIEDTVRVTVRRFFKQRMGKKPIVFVLVAERR